jgi:predicted TIM-barrel fold metal-dependent hydrolase
MDTFAALIFHNLFGRFPGLRILSVENGSRWVPQLLQEMDAAYRFVAGNPMSRWVGGPVETRPSELFRRHVWVAPFLDTGHELELDRLVDAVGADRLLFGSDWPHGEGRDTPRHFERELAPLAPDDREKVLRTNTAALLRL